MARAAPYLIGSLGVDAPPNTHVNQPTFLHSADATFRFWTDLAPPARVQTSQHIFPSADKQPPDLSPISSPSDQADGGALLENVRERGEQLRAGLEELRQKYPQTIAGKRRLPCPCLHLSTLPCLGQPCPDLPYLERPSALLPVLCLRLSCVCRYACCLNAFLSSNTQE